MHKNYIDHTRDNFTSAIQEVINSTIKIQGLTGSTTSFSNRVIFAIGSTGMEYSSGCKFTLA
jgi:hypothetical protein